MTAQPTRTCRVRLGGWLTGWLIAMTAGTVSASTTDQAYVVAGTQGQAIARWLTHDDHCPDIRIDGRTMAMHERAAPGEIAQRTTASPASESRPSRFNERVCEHTLPRTANHASIAGQTLPLLRPTIRRIVVIGDTGCRLKAGGGKWQACNDPAQYPFSQIAQTAAAWHPDLVIHVGDYLYRENACPAGMAGCTGSPWGYGSDAWRADFLEPAKPLLDAAPWIMVRGNHESCNRAGQGWWRFLDPHPLTAEQRCDVASNDFKGNFSDAYAVPLGGDMQVIVLDTSAAPNKPLDPQDPAFEQFKDMYRQMATLASQARDNIIVNHQPILGFAAHRSQDRTVLLPGNPTLQNAFGSLNPRYFPAHVDLLLSGHVHTWEQISFANDYPSQFVTGFSGTQEESVPLPEQLPDNATPAKPAKVSAFSSWTTGFGYMTMERTGPSSWSAAVHDTHGNVIKTCVINGKTSRCSAVPASNVGTPSDEP